MTKSKLVRTVSILEFVTAVIGLVTVFSMFTSSGFSLEMGIITMIVVLIPIPYLLAAFWLWQGKKKGLFLSIAMTAIALVDFDTANFSFYLTNGLYLNYPFFGQQIDLWSLIILIGLITILIRNIKVEPSDRGQ